MPARRQIGDLFLGVMRFAVQSYKRSAFAGPGGRYDRLMFPA